MKKLLDPIRRYLILKIGIPVAAVLFACIFIWSTEHIEHEEQFAMTLLVNEAERTANTVKLGLHYAMMLNSRDDIRAIVNNYSRVGEIREIRVLNMAGQVMFSPNPEDQNKRIPQSDPMCQVCHRQAELVLNPNLADRVYGDSRLGGEHVLRLVNPIFNEESCSTTSSCHFHGNDEKVLGVLDLAFSLGDSESLVAGIKQRTIILALSVFVISFVTLFVLVIVLIKRPIGKIIKEVNVLNHGERLAQPLVDQPDEIGQLSDAICRMGNDLITQKNALALQRNIYQDLFEGVPCLVTVQDRNYRLQSFNRTFGDRFSAKIGDYCYKAYKNLDRKCPNCPVERTFRTGQSQTTEESGLYKDGSNAHWIVTTAPIYDTEGNIVAAMEMCLDITSRKELEKELRRSEKNYFDIFNNINSSVFVVDPGDFSILDCNRSATSLYGYSKEELLGHSLLDLFADMDKDGLIESIRAGKTIDQIRQITKGNQEFFASIRSAPSEFFGREVFLITASDITQRLETEQQLIQASKMATLGEMATGVAHELNQPLAVIQTSVDLVKRSLARDEMPAQPILRRVTELVGAQIDRATKIIGHMREFGRKSDRHTELVSLNDVLRRSFEFFSQQLSLRNIEVVWDLNERLAQVDCEPNRMEQVFINLFINGRDAIEERAQSDPQAPRTITVKTSCNQDFVTVRISDTGVGVPQAYQDKIFEPFFTTKQVGKGTGLGLSISYGIVQECGGTITVANNKSGGASFFIRLPVAGAPAGTAAERAGGAA